MVKPEVLAVLEKSPAKKYTVEQIESATGKSVPAIRSAVKELIEENRITATKGEKIRTLF